MNSLMLRNLVAGLGGHGTPPRNAASGPDETAAFSEALSVAEGGKHHRHGRTDSEPGPSLTKLAGRLAEAMAAPGSQKRDVVASTAVGEEAEGAAAPDAIEAGARAGDRKEAAVVSATVIAPHGIATRAPGEPAAPRQSAGKTEFASLPREAAGNDAASPSAASAKRATQGTATAKTSPAQALTAAEDGTATALQPASSGQPAAQNAAAPVPAGAAAVEAGSGVKIAATSDAMPFDRTEPAARKTTPHIAAHGASADPRAPQTADRPAPAESRPPHPVDRRTPPAVVADKLARDVRVPADRAAIAGDLHPSGAAAQLPQIEQSGSPRTEPERSKPADPLSADTMSSGASDASPKAPHAARPEQPEIECGKSPDRPATDLREVSEGVSCDDVPPVPAAPADSPEVRHVRSEPVDHEPVDGSEPDRGRPDASAQPLVAQPAHPVTESMPKGHADHAAAGMIEHNAPPLDRTTQPSIAVPTEQPKVKALRNEPADQSAGSVRETRGRVMDTPAKSPHASRAEQPTGDEDGSLSAGRPAESASDESGRRVSPQPLAAAYDRPVSAANGAPARSAAAGLSVEHERLPDRPSAVAGAAPSGQPATEAVQPAVEAAKPVTEMGQDTPALGAGDPGRPKVTGEQGLPGKPAPLDRGARRASRQQPDRHVAEAMSHDKPAAGPFSGIATVRATVDANVRNGAMQLSGSLHPDDESDSEWKGVTVIATETERPLPMRAAVDLAATVGPGLAAASAPASRLSAEISMDRPTSAPLEQMSLEMKPETAETKAASPSEKELSLAQPEKNEDGDAAFPQAGDVGGQAAPSRIDAPVIRPADSAPAAARPGVTAASILGPLLADPVLRSAVAGAAGVGIGVAQPAGAARSLQIQLRPVELGAVTATLRMSDDRLSVELATENAEAYRQLSNDSDTIVNALRGLGLQVDQVTVQPPQPASAAASRPEGGMPGQASGSREGFAQAGNSSGDNSGARGRNDGNEGDRNGAPLRQHGASVQEARPGRGLVI